tara:strand:- start:4524 stop:5276 length:753 start_codon:yes stop_codon:yes gene_type:complete
MKIYTYHEDVEFKKQLELIKLWKESWSRQGFDPIVLDRNDAKQSPLYQQYYDFVQNVHKKSVGIELKDNSYWMAAQLEIVAWHTIKEPSFISDYDVINKNWQCRWQDKHELKGKVHWRDDCCSCFASGNSWGWKKYIQFLLNSEACIIEWCKDCNRKRQRTHFGDQDFLIAVSNLEDFMHKTVTMTRSHFKLCVGIDNVYGVNKDKRFDNAQTYHLGHSSLYKIINDNPKYKDYDVDSLRIKIAKEIMEL